MNEVEIFRMVGQGGIAVGALIILARVVYRIGERMIAAIDRVGTRIDDHTKEDLAAVAELRQDIAVLDARVEQAIDIRRELWEHEPTPVGGRMTTPVGTIPIPVARDKPRPAGEYSHRPGTERGPRGRGGGG